MQRLTRRPFSLCVLSVILFLLSGILYTDSVAYASDSPWSFRSDFEETTPVYPEHLSWSISHLINMEPLPSRQRFWLNRLTGAFYDVVSDRAHSGTRCLYLQLSDVAKNRRNQLEILSGQLFGNEVFVSIWLFLPSDWTLNSPTGKWYELSNLCRPRGSHFEDDLAVKLHIVQREDEGFAWRLYATPSYYRPVWSAVNSDVEVPRGRWFNLEYYVKRSMNPSEGRAMVRMDNQLLFDITNKTGDSEDCYATVPAQILCGSDDYTMRQLWADDLQIYTPDTTEYHATLLFQSGLENPVEFTDSTKQFLKGDDQGFDWDNTFHLLNYVGGIVGDEVDTFLTVENAHGGTRSLKQVVMKPFSGTPHRNELNFYTNDFNAEYELYISRWLYYPSDLFVQPNKQLMGITSHREVSGTGWGFDVGVGWAKHSSGYEYLYCDCLDYNEGAGSYSDWIVWREDKRITPPRGEWFKLEDYVYRHPSDGIYQVWLNGELIFDIQGKPTMKNTMEIVHHRIGKIYTNMDVAYFPFCHYLDDVEIWDGMPQSHDYSTTNYSPPSTDVDS